VTKSNKLIDPEGPEPQMEEGWPALPGWKIDQLSYPTFHVTLIAKIMDRMTIRLLAERGDITYAEWRVMARLATMPAGGTVGQVADLAWVDKAEVSRAIARLEAKGFLTRRLDRKDRRVPIVTLTLAGLQRYEIGIQERIAFHESLLVDFSPEERRALDQMLERLGSRILQLIRLGGEPEDEEEEE
jgi:DNA-binding MarR family transcriptional regulator